MSCVERAVVASTTALRGNNEGAPGPSNGISPRQNGETFMPLAAACEEEWEEPPASEDEETLVANAKRADESFLRDEWLREHGPEMAKAELEELNRETAKRVRFCGTRKSANGMSQSAPLRDREDGYL